MLLLPLPPKPGSSGSYAGQSVSTQLPILGEQFRNVNIVPQVITYDRKSTKFVSWQQSLSSLKMLEESSSVCVAMHMKAIAVWKKAQTKQKFRPTSQTGLLCTHTGERKKKNHKMIWSLCTCVLWCQNRSSNSVLQHPLQIWDPTPCQTSTTYSYIPLAYRKTWCCSTKILATLNAYVQEYLE